MLDKNKSKRLNKNEKNKKGRWFFPKSTFVRPILIQFHSITTLIMTLQNNTVNATTWMN